MQIREACIEDAEQACDVIRRSIAELCRADHHGDDHTIALWLANKTAQNMRRWISQNHVLVATERGAILGVGAIKSSGEITLNYISPDAQFRRISKALVAGLEARAEELGIETVTVQSSATARRFYRSLGYADTGPPTQGFGATFGYPMAKQLGALPR